VQKPLVDLGDERQLIKILNRLTLLVANDLARRCPAPYQALDRGEIGATGFRLQPVAHRILVLAHRDRL